MGLLDWLRPKRPRASSDIARDLAIVMFDLHSSAGDRIEITFAQGRIVAMDVPGGDPTVALAATDGPAAERGAAIAKASAMLGELRVRMPVAGDQVTVMRDRLLWMPVVIGFPLIAPTA